MAWGTPIANMNTDDSWCRARLKDRAEDMQTTVCPLHYVGDIHVSLLILYFQPDDTLTGYSMTFESDSYAKMRGVAIERFGPPTSTAIEQHRTRLGDSVSGELLEWRWRSGTLAYLSEVCKTLGQSCLTVSTKRLADLRRNEEEDKEKGRGKERKKEF